MEVLLGLLAAGVQTSLYGSVVKLQTLHGFNNPALEGYQLRPSTTAAVNTLYTYVEQLAQSPPPLEIGHDVDSLIACTPDVCTVNPEILENTDDTLVYIQALRELLIAYGVEQPQSNNDGIVIDDFAALGGSRACFGDADCTKKKGRIICCEPTQTVPGVCCSPRKLNEHDAEIPMAVIVIALSVTGIVSAYWLFTCFRRINQKEDFDFS